MSKALIVEDDPSIAAALSKLLKHHDWLSEIADNGVDGLQLLEQFSFDLLLLDWGLPGMSGLEVCKRVRARGDTLPILFVTAQSDIDSTEAGLEAGGDDYITKPFNERELMARVKTVMRRPRAILEVGMVQVGNLTFDEKLRTISTKDGKRAQLTATEYGVINYLLRHRNESFTSQQLFSAVWHSDVDSSEETVRVHIRVLRKKLELAGMPQIINHRRGFGYSLDLFV